MQVSNISKIAGWAYLVIFFTGIFANFFVIENLVVVGDPGSTLSNILDNDFLFRIGSFSFVIMVLADLVVAWALYILFRKVDNNLSMFAAWFRLVNVAIFGVALYNLISVISLTAGSGFIKTSDNNILANQVLLALDTFNITWLVGLIFFGVSLLALGKLILKSGAVPKFIGYLLLIAGVGYLIDSTAFFLMADYSNYKEIFQMIVIIPGVAGELSLTIWLIAKGKKLDVVNV